MVEISRKEAIATLQYGQFRVQPVDILNDVSDTDEENQSTGQSGAGKAVKTAPPGINNNQDVIKALNLISDYYRKKEPSSPIPLLIERVIGLVGKDFMEVLQDMAPNGVEQVEFLRGPSASNNE